MKRNMDFQKMKNFKNQFANSKFSNVKSLNAANTGLLLIGGIGLAALVWRQFSKMSMSMPVNVTNEYGDDHRLNRMISDVSMDETSAYMENPSPS